MAWMYILECADGSFYVGSTIDLDGRLWQHQEGRGAAYTRPRRRRPVKLAYAADFARIDEAFAFEKQVQGWSRAKRIALIEGRLTDLPELAVRRSRSTYVTWEAERATAAAKADPDVASDHGRVPANPAEVSTPSAVDGLRAQPPDGG